MEGEATPTRSVPLPMVEEEEEEEGEEGEAEEEEAGGGGDVVAMATTSLWIFIKSIKMESTVSYSFYKCHCSR